MMPKQPIEPPTALVMPDGNLALTRAARRRHFWRPIGVTLLEAWPLGLGGPFFTSDGQTAAAWYHARHEFAPRVS